jgi:hypothetical protein
MGSISLGIDFVAGRNLVPNPAAGITAFRTFMGDIVNRNGFDLQGVRIRSMKYGRAVERERLDRNMNLGVWSKEKEARRVE